MRQRLVVAGILGGLVALIALGVVVLRFGRFDPSPPSLPEHPNPAIPGEILYIDRDGCIMLAMASGSSRRQVYCLPEGPSFGPFLVTRLDPGTIAYLRPAPDVGGLRYVVVEIDLETRAAQDTGRVVTADRFSLVEGLGGRTAPGGESVQTDEDGRVFIVANGVRTQIADFDVAEHRGPQPLTWSPDGAWILLRYYPRNADGESELWILSRDGRTQGTIATNAGGPPAGSWWIDGLGSWPRLEGVGP